MILAAPGIIRRPPLEWSSFKVAHWNMLRQGWSAVYSSVGGFGQMLFRPNPGGILTPGAMGAAASGITFVFSGDDTAANGGDVTVDMSAWSLAENDLVVVGAVEASDTDEAMAMSSSGYTEPFEGNSADVYDTNYAAYYKKMGSTPDTTAVYGGTGDLSNAVAMTAHAFRGVDTTTPMDVTPTTAEAPNSVLANPPSITPTTSGAVIVIMGFGAHSGGNGLSYSTSGLENFRTRSRNDTYDCQIGTGWVAWTSGAYNHAAFSWDGTDDSDFSWGAIAMALRPA